MRANFGRRAPWPALVALVAGVGMAWAPWANADCYSRAGFYYDICQSGTPSSTYELSTSSTSFPVTISGNPYLVLVLVNDVVLYNLANSLSPRIVASVHIPWDWNNVPGGGTHGPYISHVRDVATGGSNFNYAFVPMYEYGWDILKLDATNPHFLGVGYEPPGVDASPPYMSGAILESGGEVFVISQALDNASINAGDASIKIYKLRDSSGQVTPETLTYKTIQSVRTVPVGHSGDAAPYNTFPLPAGGLTFKRFTFSSTGKTYVIARASQSAAVVIDVTQAAQATPVALWNNSGSNDPLFNGSWAINERGNQTWLFVPDAHIDMVHRFSISPETLGATEMEATPWYGTGTASNNGSSFVGTFGDLVVVAGDLKKVGYLSLAGGTPTLLPQTGFPWTDLDTNLCPGTNFQQYAAGVSVYQGNDYAYYVSRALNVNADVVRIDPSCMSTVPSPNFTVTGGSSAATCAKTSTYPQAEAAFPGDTLTIHDTSGGVYSSVTLDIQGPLPSTNSVGTAWGSLQISAHGSVVVTPPANTLPGDYAVVLTIPGGQPSFTTQVISLCGNPKAVLTVTVNSVACPNPGTGCGALVNDQVVLGDTGTQGTPSAPIYLYQQGNGLVYQLLGTPPSFTPQVAATYTVGVIVPYAFAYANDSMCSDPFLTGQVPGVGTYYSSCAIGTVNAGYGTASFQVEQPANTKVADASSPGFVNVAQDVTLRFTGRLASGYYPNFTWAIPPLSGQPTCSYAGWPTTAPVCTIAANTLTPGPQADWNLSVDVCNSGGLGAGCTGPPAQTVAAPVVKVQPTQNTFSFAVDKTSVNIGDPITITLGSVVGTYSNLVFNLGGTTCTGATQQSVLCNIGGQCITGATLPTFSYAAAGTYTITATGTLAAGGSVTSPTQAQVTVQTSGACATCDTPTAPAPTSPSNGATVTGSSVTLAWSASTSASTPISYDVYVGLINVCSSVSGTSCTVSNLTNGTYNWYVRATNACNNYTDSSTSSFTVTGGGSSGTLTITPDKNPANQGDTVTFTFTPVINQSGDQLVFSFGDGGQLTVLYSPTCQIFGGCKVATHTYLSSGPFTVSASGTAGGQSVSGSTSITINNTCAQQSAPIANFTWTPTQPQVGQVVTFTDTSTNVPTQWLWSFGDGGSSTAQNPTYTYQTANTYTVTLTATNCRGSGTVQLPLTVLPACNQSAVPTPDFTWSPQGALAQFPQQMQPYVGQTVTFTDTSTNNPTAWKWWDFNLPQPWTPVTTQTTAFTWTTPGDKVVRHQAYNCAGWSPETFYKTVTVWADVRPVSADFTWTPDPITTGTTITFAADQGFTYGDPSVFTWTFDDSATPSNGSSVTHNFACAGQHNVTLSAQRGSYSDTESKTLTVTGTQCGPVSVQAVDASNTAGKNNTYWTSDVRVFNPSAQPMSVSIAALPVVTDNSQQSPVGQGVLNPHAALVLNNILGTTAQFAQYTNAALRMTYQNADGIAPIVTNCTHTPSPNGGSFGQYAPGVPVYVGMTPATLWITGLRNNGLDQGYRTNYSIANLRGDAGGVPNVAATLYDATGTAVAGTKFFPALQPFGYLHDSVANLFGGTTQTIGTFALKIDVPQGADIEVFASVVDNLTGDPFLIPGTSAPNSPIFIPAVAHTTGLAGSVWLSDLQLTNPDLSNAHAYVVEYRPKASDNLPNASKTVSVAAGANWRVDELVGWLYGASLSASTNTSGVLHITPSVGSTSYPIVAARSYNQTANGTFGQNILPQVAAMGVQTYTDGRKLLLTGMSSRDIARTNVGFVNLSETQGVYFVVYFYDESGNVLNPKDPATGLPMPYELSLDVGGWSQQLLEDMFLKSSWGMTLPSNRVISAIAQVISGGPGMIYATVIDNQTNDGNFIPAQASQAGMQ